MTPQRRKTKPRSNITYDAIEFYILTNKKIIKEKIIDIRERYGIDSYSLEESSIKGAEELNDEDQIYEYLLLDQEFQSEVNNILKLTNLSDRWFDAVFGLIVLGQNIIFDAKFKPDGVNIVSINGNRNNILLELGKDTTLDDIIMKWPNIQKAISRLPGKKSRRKPSKNFFRDYLIYRMSARGKKTNEIYSEMKKDYGDLDFGNIETIIKRFKKRLK